MQLTTIGGFTNSPRPAIFTFQTSSACKAVGLVTLNRLWNTWQQWSNCFIYVLILGVFENIDLRYNNEPSSSVIRLLGQNAICLKL